MTPRIPFNLPPLRSKILKSFSILIFVYALLGVFMMTSVFLATGVTPKALHRNYDSIEVASEMQEAWSALKNPRQFQLKSDQEWIHQFERALKFEEDNVTEIGEDTLTKEIKFLWIKNKQKISSINDVDTKKFTNFLMI